MRRVGHTTRLSRCGMLAAATAALLACGGICAAKPPAAADANVPKQPGKSDGIPYAPDSTYRQRMAASPRSAPAKVDMLMLPHPVAMRYLGGPFVRKAGARLGFLNHPDDLIWECIALDDSLREYLTKRKELLGKKQDSALIDWCERSDLTLCAEFELRRLLSKMRNFRDPAYQKLCRHWLRYADRREIGYSFPLPVESEWSVLTDRTNHHRLKGWAAHAWDLVIKKRGAVCKGDRKVLENYYCWDQPIIAQADGVVVAVEDQYEDSPIGKYGAYDKANTVTVDYGGGILGHYGHLKQGSAKVKVRQKVKVGQELARVGNSGASGMPHLHFCFTDRSSFSVKGRFRCQFYYGGWKTLEGKDLRGGQLVRNIPADPEKPGIMKESDPREPGRSPRPVKTTQPAATATESPEAKAQSQLNLAENYSRAGLSAKAMAILRSIVKDFPDTASAKKAAEQIKELESDIKKGAKDS